MSDHDFRVAVIGAGFMGWQIALQCAAGRHTVTLMDVSDSALEKARLHIESEIRRRVTAGTHSEQEGYELLARIQAQTDLRAAAGDAEFVIEAIPEQLNLKRETFRQLDAVCRDSAIIATNSSSLRISEIESEEIGKTRLLNMHFYGPVWERPMVELMRGSETTTEVVERACSFARSIGVTPLLVRRDSTGLIFNRVWRAVKKESLKVADQGVATHEDIDRAWMIFNNQKMGPFGLMDMIGLDVIRDIEMVYYRNSGDPADAPPGYLLDRTEAGDLGVKTGKGFYEYPHPAFERPDFI